jgi:hypothetical protein
LYNASIKGALSPMRGDEPSGTPFALFGIVCCLSSETEGAESFWVFMLIILEEHRLGCHPTFLFHLHNHFDLYRNAEGKLLHAHC